MDRIFLRKFIGLMYEWDLEPSELLYLYIHHYLEIPDLIYYAAYGNSSKNIVTEIINGKRNARPKKKRLIKENIDRMIERGIIKSEYKEEEEDTYNLFEIELTDKAKSILEERFGNSESYGDEFWNLYPVSYSGDGGKNFPLKAVDKQDFIRQYEEKVSKEAHDTKVIPYLRSKKHEINYSIVKFLASEPWVGFVNTRKSNGKLR